LLWEQLILQTSFVDYAQQRHLRTPCFPGEYSPPTAISSDGRYVEMFLRDPPPPNRYTEWPTSLWLWDMYMNRASAIQLEPGAGVRNGSLSLHVAHDLVISGHGEAHGALWCLDASGPGRMIFAASEWLANGTWRSTRRSLALAVDCKILVVREEHAVSLYRVDALKQGSLKQGNEASAIMMTWTGVCAVASSEASSNIILAGAFEASTLYKPAEAGARYRVPTNTVQHWKVDVGSSAPVLVASRAFADFPALPGRLKLSGDGNRVVTLTRRQEHVEANMQFSTACTWELNSSAWVCATISTLGYAEDSVDAISSDGRFWMYVAEGKSTLRADENRNYVALVYDLHSADAAPIAWTASCDFLETEIRNAAALIFEELRINKNRFTSVGIISATYSSRFADLEEPEEMLEQRASVRKSHVRIRARRVLPGWSYSGEAPDEAGPPSLFRDDRNMRHFLLHRPSGLSPDGQWALVRLDTPIIAGAVFPIYASQIRHRVMLDRICTKPSTKRRHDYELDREAQ
jgi:hypothetical protein